MLGAHQARRCFSLEHNKTGHAAHPYSSSSMTAWPKGPCLVRIEIVSHEDGGCEGRQGKGRAKDSCEAQIYKM
eukprot:103950-Pleurochrysis_carterae.AAC.1